MSTVTDALFTWPLGDDEALIPRTPAIADALFALVRANFPRLGQWFPHAYQEDFAVYGLLAREWRSTGQ